MVTPCLADHNIPHPPRTRGGVALSAGPLDARGGVALAVAPLDRLSLRSLACRPPHFAGDDDE